MLHGNGYGPNGFQPISATINKLDFGCEHIVYTELVFQRAYFGLGSTERQLDRIAGAFSVDAAYCQRVANVDIYLNRNNVIAAHIINMMLSSVCLCVWVCVCVYSFTSFSYVNLLFVRPQKRINGIINATHTYIQRERPGMRKFWDSMPQFLCKFHYMSRGTNCLKTIKFPMTFITRTKFENGKK